MNHYLICLLRIILIYFRVIALSAFFILPNFPRTTAWLTEEEKQLAVWRLDEDIGEDDWVSSKEQTFFHGMRLAFADIKMWILVRLSGMLDLVSAVTDLSCRWSCYGVSYLPVQ